MRSALRVLAAGAFGLSIGCASGGGGAAAADQAPEARRQSQNVVMQAELENARQSDLYDYLRAVRPRWFAVDRPGSLGANVGAIGGDSQDRGSGGAAAAAQGAGIQAIAIYADGAYLGNVEMLRRFSPSHVREVRFFSGSAAARFGATNANKVIELVTR